MTTDTNGLNGQTNNYALDLICARSRPIQLREIMVKNGGAMRVQIDNDAPREIELWRTDAGAGARIQPRNGHKSVIAYD